MTPQYFLSKFIFLDIPLGKIIREMYIKDEEVIIIDPNSHPIRHLTAHRLAHYLFHRNTKVNYFLNERVGSTIESREDKERRLKCLQLTF